MQDDTRVSGTETQRQPDAEYAIRTARQKRRRRRRRAFLSLLFRFAMLVLVVYVLFFQVLGVLSMPNGDMYPRIDAGDLVLYYRLDRDVRAQDVVVFEKDADSIQDYSAPNPIPEAEQPGEGEEAAEPADTPAPAATPVAREQTPAELVADQSFTAKLSRLLYNAATALNLRSPRGKQKFVCRVVACEGDTVEVSAERGLVVNGNAVIESNIFSTTTEYLGFTEYPLTLGPGECFVMADKRNGGADSRFFGPVHRDELLGTVVTIARRNNL